MFFVEIVGVYGTAYLSVYVSCFHLMLMQPQKGSVSQMIFIKKVKGTCK